MAGERSSHAPSNLVKRVICGACGLVRGAERRIFGQPRSLEAVLRDVRDHWVEPLAGRHFGFQFEIIMRLALVVADAALHAGILGEPARNLTLL